MPVSTILLVDELLPIFTKNFLLLRKDWIGLISWMEITMSISLKNRSECQNLSKAFSTSRKTVQTLIFRNS